jgi:hypothetical protein
MDKFERFLPKLCFLAAIAFAIGGLNAFNSYAMGRPEASGGMFTASAIALLATVIAVRKRQ